MAESDLVENLEEENSKSDDKNKKDSQKTYKEIFSKIIDDFSNFLSKRSVYEAAPENSKVLVFNSDLSFKEMIKAFINEDIYCALIYDSKKEFFVGIITISDILFLFQYIIEKAQEKTITDYNKFIKEIFNINNNKNVLIEEKENEINNEEKKEKNFDILKYLTKINYNDYYEVIKKNKKIHILYSISLDSSLLDVLKVIYKVGVHRLVVEETKKKGIINDINKKKENESQNNIFDIKTEKEEIKEKSDFKDKSDIEKSDKEKSEKKLKKVKTKKKGSETEEGKEKENKEGEKTVKKKVKKIKKKKTENELNENNDNKEKENKENKEKEDNENKEGEKTVKKKVKKIKKKKTENDLNENNDNKDKEKKSEEKKEEDKKSEEKKDTSENNTQKSGKSIIELSDNSNKEVMKLTNTEDTSKALEFPSETQNYTGFVTYETVFDFLIYNYYAMEMQEFDLSLEDLKKMPTNSSFIKPLTNFALMSDEVHLSFSKNITSKNDILPILTNDKNEIFGFLYLRDYLYFVSNCESNQNLTNEKFLINMYEGIEGEKPYGKERIIFLEYNEESKKIKIKNLLERINGAPEKKIVLINKEDGNKLEFISLKNIFDVVVEMNNNNLD